MLSPPIRSIPPQRSAGGIILSPSQTYFVQANLRSRVSSIQYFPTIGSGYGTGGTYSHAVHYTYDMHGNVDVLLREIPALADIDQDYKSVIYKYDLVSGNVNQVLYQFRQADMFAHKYVYDADNRLIETFTSHDMLHWDREAEYSYYLHGPMSRTVLGELNVQGSDYIYTLHGWIKGVNSTTLNTSRDAGRDGDDGTDNQYVAKDVYGYSLGFYEGDHTPIGLSRTSSPLQTEDLFTPLTTTSALGRAGYDLWNGNIRHMVTAIKPYMSLNGMPMARAYGYDQLNRIKDAYTYDEVELDSNLWKWTGSANPDYEEHFTFDPNGNILTLSRNGTNAGGHTRDMDDFTYHYTANTNRLEYVDDSKAAGNYTDDIDDQTSGNYTYDETGNLVSDNAEQIASIEWTVYGKIKSITRTGGSSKPDLEFEYTPDGHRVIKKVTQPDGNVSITYYIRDAQGNVMSVYTRNIDTLENDTLVWSEAHIYGSSRLGMYKPGKKLYGNGNELNNSSSGDRTINTRGDKNYELSNHLGNVLAVVSDKRTTVCDQEDNILAYEAEIIDATDYYAYGSPMPMRRNLIQCAVVYDTTISNNYSLQDTFNGNTGSFAGDINTTLSNPGGTELNASATTAYPVISASVSTVSGEEYTVSVELNSMTAAGGYTERVLCEVIEGGVTVASQSMTATGSYAFTYTAGATTASIKYTYSLTPLPGPPPPPPAGPFQFAIDNALLYSLDTNVTGETVCVGKKGYAYGFNGHKKDDEIKGNGNHISWGDYGYDTRLGRRWNQDPQWQKLPGQSPYSANNNSSIQYTDPDGKIGILGAAIGFVVGAVTEIGSQVVSNVVQGKPAFSKIDWADVAISGGQGAVIGSTGGVGFIAAAGFEAAKASVDVTYDSEKNKLGVESIGGIVGEEKKLLNVGIDFGAGLVGIGAGKFLPAEKLVSDAVAGQWVKNGIKSPAHFATGMLVTDLAGGLAGAVVVGSAAGLFKRGAVAVWDAYKSGGSKNPIMLPGVTISSKKAEITPDGKITPKGEEKIQKHIRKNVEKR